MFFVLGVNVERAVAVELDVVAVADRKPVE
jgi:hypothetical protein